MNLYIQLFTSFCKIGSFTFGGGWAMIPIIEKEMVKKKQWIGEEDFIDLLAVAQSLPGVLAVNIAIVIGHKLRGIKGSLVAAFGTIIPSFLIIMAIVLFLKPYYTDPVVEAVFKGIRPAVVALILSPVFSTAKTAKLKGWIWALPIIIALAVWWLDVSPVWIILGTILYAIFRQYLANCQVKK